MLNRLQDVFKSFQEHDVKYVVIGDIASILHGVPRATFDLDILIDATPENTQHLLDALLDAGFGTAASDKVTKALRNDPKRHISSLGRAVTGRGNGFILKRHSEEKGFTTELTEARS